MLQTFSKAAPELEAARVKPAIVPASGTASEFSDLYRIFSAPNTVAENLWRANYLSQD